MSADPKTLRTTYLGQFEEDRAQRIAEALDDAEISWFVKETGRISRIFFADAWGVRLFVDGTRVDEARQIVARTDGSIG